MNSKLQRSRIRDPVALHQKVVPHFACNTQLRNILHELHAHAEIDSAQTSRNFSKRKISSLSRFVKMLNCAGKNRTQFLVCVEPSVGTVVSSDRNGYPLGNMLCTEVNDVAIDFQTIPRRDLLLCNTTEVREEKIALSRAGKFCNVYTTPFCNSPIGRQGKRGVLDYCTTWVRKILFLINSLYDQRGISSRKLHRSRKTNIFPS